MEIYNSCKTGIEFFLDKGDDLLFKNQRQEYRNQYKSQEAQACDLEWLFHGVEFCLKDIYRRREFIIPGNNQGNTLDLFLIHSLLRLNEPSTDK
jgi:hypothetical protein